MTAHNDPRALARELLEGPVPNEDVLLQQITNSNYWKDMFELADGNWHKLRDEVRKVAEAKNADPKVAKKLQRAIEKTTYSDHDLDPDQKGHAENQAGGPGL